TQVVISSAAALARAPLAPTSITAATTPEGALKLGWTVSEPDRIDHFVVAARPVTENFYRGRVDVAASSRSSFGKASALGVPDGPFFVSVAAVDAAGHESLFAYPEYRCTPGGCAVPTGAMDVTAAIREEFGRPLDPLRSASPTTSAAGEGARHRDHLHLRGPAFEQREGGSAGGRAGGEHVVDQQQLLSADHRRRGAKGAGDVLISRALRQTDLPRRASIPRQPVPQTAPAGELRQLASQQLRLIVLALAQARAVQRDGADRRRRLRQKARRFAGQHGAESRRQLWAVLVLEAMNGARDRAVGEKWGEGARKGRRAQLAARAPLAVELAWLAAAGAIGCGQSLQLQLAPLAKGRSSRQHLAAACAGRREENLEQSSGPSSALGGARQKSPC